jgi:hypothetical protein
MSALVLVAVAYTLVTRATRIAWLVQRIVLAVAVALLVLAVAARR